MAMNFTKQSESAWHEFPENNGGISKLGRVHVAPNRQLQLYNAVLWYILVWKKMHI